MCKEIFWTPAPATTAFKLSKIKPEVLTSVLPPPLCSTPSRKCPVICLRKAGTLQAASVLQDIEFIEDFLREKELCPRSSHKESEISPDPGHWWCHSPAPKGASHHPFSLLWPRSEDSELWKSHQQCKLTKKSGIWPQAPPIFAFTIKGALA